MNVQRPQIQSLRPWASNVEHCTNLAFCNSHWSADRCNMATGLECTESGQSGYTLQTVVVAIVVHVFVTTCCALARQVHFMGSGERKAGSCFGCLPPCGKQAEVTRKEDAHSLLASRGTVYVVCLAWAFMSDKARAQVRRGCGFGRQLSAQKCN